MQKAKRFEGVVKTCRWPTTTRRRSKQNFFMQHFEKSLFLLTSHNEHVKSRARASESDVDHKSVTTECHDSLIHRFGNFRTHWVDRIKPNSLATKSGSSNSLTHNKPQNLLDLLMAEFPLLSSCFCLQLFHSMDWKM